MTVIPKFKIKGDKKLNKYIKKQMKYLQNPKRTFARIKIVMLQDVLRHFKEQKSNKGKWKSLKPMTLFQRKQEGRGGKILRDKGDLMNSLTAVSSKKSAVVGTNKPHARIHNEGGTIPARFVAPVRKNVLSWVNIAGQRFFSKGHRIPPTKIPERRFAWLSNRANQRALNFFVLDLRKI